MTQAPDRPPDGDALERVLAGLRRPEGLPASPGAVRATLRLADDEAHAVRDVAGAVLDDPALTERVLRVANAAAVGIEGGVRTVTQAVRLLGIDALRTIALSLSIVDRIDAPEHRELVRLELSFAVAASCVACELAAARGEPAEPAAIVALLRATGRLAVAAWAPRAYLAIRTQAAAEALPESAVARRRIGKDFGEIAQLAVRAWGLPERFAAAVARWRERCEGAEAVAAVAVDAVEVAAADGALGSARTRAAVLAALPDASPAAVDEALASARQRFASLAGALGLPDALGPDGPCVLARAAQDAAARPEASRAEAPAAPRDAAGRPAGYRERLARAAAALSEAALRGAARPALVEQAIGSMHDAMGFHRSLVALGDPRGGALRVCAMRGPTTARLAGWRLEPGGPDLLSAALARDASLSIADASLPRIRAALPAGFDDALPGAASFVLLPMRDQGRVLGFLYGDRDRTDALTDADDVASLTALKTQLLLALRVARR